MDFFAIINDYSMFFQGYTFTFIMITKLNPLNLIKFMLSRYNSFYQKYFIKFNEGILTLYVSASEKNCINNLINDTVQNCSLIYIDNEKLIYFFT